jgi:hypothetical protein
LQFIVKTHKIKSVLISANQRLKISRLAENNSMANPLALHWELGKLIFPTRYKFGSERSSAWLEHLLWESKTAFSSDMFSCVLMIKTL